MLPHDSRAPGLLAVSILFLVLGLTFFGLRLWVRFRIQKAFYADDWLTGITLVCFCLHVSLQSYSISKGYGKHLYDMRGENLVLCIKLWWIETVVFIFSVCFLRLSVGALFLRVIPKNSVRYAWATRKAIYIIQLFNILWTLGSLMFMILSCTPTSYFWTRLQGAKGRCPVTKHQHLIWLRVFSVTSGVEDLLLAVVPAVVVYQLHLPKRSRIGVHFVMVLGCVAGIGNWVRLRYFVQYLNSSDFFYNSVPVGVWSTTETGIGFVAANAATLRPLLQDMKLPSFLQRAPREQTLPSFVRPVTDSQAQTNSMSSGGFKSEGHAEITHVEADSEEHNGALGKFFKKTKAKFSSA